MIVTLIATSNSEAGIRLWVPSLITLPQATEKHKYINVFADLDFPDAEEMQTKVRLAVRILRTIEARGLTQVEAAELVGLKQPDISNLRRAQLGKFAIDRLLRLLRRLGHTVGLQVSS